MSRRTHMLKVRTHRGPVEVDAWPTSTAGLMVIPTGYTLLHTTTSKALPCRSWLTRDPAQTYATMLGQLCDWTAKQPAARTCPRCAGDQLLRLGCPVCTGLGLIAKEDS